MNLASVPSTQLEAELKRRSQQAEQDRLEAQRQRYELAMERGKVLGQVLAQPGVVDALAPEHDRFGCTDENLQNGYGTEIRLPRCRRCQLLGAAKDGLWPAYLTLTFHIDHWR